MHKTTNIFIGVFAVLTMLLHVDVSYGGEIRYIGSSTVGKFIRDAREVYKNSTFRINTKPESSGGEKCVTAGSCNMGGVARDVKQTVLNSGVVATTIGKDAIAAIVHPSNKVSELSLSQLSDIFTGRVNNWKEVGGLNMPIKAYITDNNSATNKVFRKIVLQGKAYNAKVVRPDAKIVRLVSSQEGAIGQISFAFILGNKKVKPVRPDGQEASVHNNHYPITRPLNIVSMGKPSGEVKEFLDWALSSNGQEIVKKKFIGIN